MYLHDKLKAIGYKGQVLDDGNVLYTDYSPYFILKCIEDNVVEFCGMKLVVSNQEEYLIFLNLVTSINQLHLHKDFSDVKVGNYVQCKTTEYKNLTYGKWYKREDDLSFKLDQDVLMVKDDNGDLFTIGILERFSVFNLNDVRQVIYNVDDPYEGKRWYDE